MRTACIGEQFQIFGVAVLVEQSGFATAFVSEEATLIDDRTWPMLKAYEDVATVSSQNGLRLLTEVEYPLRRHRSRGSGDIKVETEGTDSRSRPE